MYSNVQICVAVTTVRRRPEIFCIIVAFVAGTYQTIKKHSRVLLRPSMTRSGHEIFSFSRETLVWRTRYLGQTRLDFKYIYKNGRRNTFTFLRFFKLTLVASSKSRSSPTQVRLTLVVTRQKFLHDRLDSRRQCTTK